MLRFAEMYSDYNGYIWMFFVILNLAYVNIAIHHSIRYISPSGQVYTPTLGTLPVARLNKLIYIVLF